MRRTSDNRAIAGRYRLSAESKEQQTTAEHVGYSISGFGGYAAE